MSVFRSAVRGIVSASVMASACSVGTLHASNDNDWWFMGPVGGKFQVQAGQPYVVVRAVDAGSPAEAAGLQVGDYIMGAYGRNFLTTGGSTAGYKGAPQGLAEAIERAEASDGQMELTVLRPGVGAVDLTVSLPVAGAFGAAYPLGSTKFDSIYQEAASEIHSHVTGSSDANMGYMTGFYGLVLIADPNWNDTTGAKPYRLSVDKLKDRCVTLINNAILVPAEETNMDGTPNDGSENDSDPNDNNYVGPGLENWDLSVSAMYLAEYRKKTGDTSVDAAVQRAADALANRIQTWQQPPYGGNNGPTKVGLMGHGGVVGDYPHIGYSGINIINAHAMAALAMLEQAGATVDDTKMQASWNWVKGTTTLNNGADDGNIGYAWQQGGYDSGGRTAGVAYAMSVYGGLNQSDQGVLTRMKDYLSRQWQRMQHTHAYTVGGNQFYQFVLPYLPDRDQRFIMENQRMFYHFHRKVDGTLGYFGGRENNGGDGYVNTYRVALTNVGIAQAVASGGLTTIAPLDNTRIHAEFQSPFLTWPTLDARKVELDTQSQAFTVDITDYQGTSLQPADYTATWTHVSGPGTATFTSANTPSTTVNFPQDGTYRIQLEVVKGSYTLTEPIDVVVDTSVDPIGYVLGKARQRIYTGISGLAVSDLTGSANYPDSPNATGTLTALDSSGIGDSLGQRISGYLVAPSSGAYTFYVAADDSAEFRLNSAGTDPAGASTICSVNSWVSQYNWTANASQTSSAVTLTEGQMYYYEVLHKEGGGGDHVAVAWTGPGIASPTVISGDVLAVADTVSIVAQPEAQTTTLGGSVSFDISVEGDGPFIYEWISGSTSFGVGSSSSLSLENVGAGHAGDYYCVVTYPGGSLTSATTTLTITDAGILAGGGLWRDQFDGIGGGAITDLTGNSNYPRFPSSGGVITNAESASGIADSYGARWTGWVRPDVTGTYYFYITSDDASQLWLSTDDQPANKVQIASVGGYTGARSWSSGGQSVAISLVAGERYYIEVLHKEGGGGDHCAVAWRKPGDAVPANGSAPIPSQYLEYFTGGVQGSSVTMPPTFGSTSYAMSVAENSGVGVSVGTVSATDAGGNTPLTYSITAGNTGSMFAIDSSTGEITTAGDPDYESLDSYSLTVRATNTLGESGQATVNVAVLNRLDGTGSWEVGVDEGTPVALKYATGLAGNTTASVDLSAISGDATYEFLVDAEDNGQAALNVLAANGWSLRFEQWNNTARLGITQSGVADWQFTAESGQSLVSPYGRQVHMVYVVDTTAGETRLYVDSVLVGRLNRTPNLANAAATLGDTGMRNDAEPGILGFAAYNSALDATEIQAHYDDWRGDVPNAAPVADDATFALDEQQVAGTVVGTVTASDTNAGDALTFAITSGDPAGDFVIDAVTGEITTAAELNYDLATQYVLGVTVTDINGLSDIATVTVNVNNLPGGVSDWELAVDAGATVLHKRTASVPGNSTVNVDLSAISGDATYEFVVDSVNYGQVWGNLLAANGWQLRNEQWNNTNELGATLSGNADWRLTAETGQSVATPYGRVAHITYVVDTTAGELRAYVDGVLVGRLSQQPNLSNAAAVLGSANVRNDSEPGILVFAAYNSALDAAEIAAHSDAWFGNEPANAAPTANDGSFSVAENQPAGTAVGTVSATDPNAGDVLSYAITAGNAGGEFAIDAATGAITTTAALDYEAASVYALTVTVTDSGALSDTAAITVTVTDENEAPVATGGSSSLPENVIAGSAVATVAVSDVDAGDSASFAITSGNTGGAFAVDAAGNITTATALDYETTSSYALVVTVTDNGGLTDTAALNVNVTNVNEAPVATDGSGSLAEDATVGSAVATVAVSDPDAGDSASFAITSGNTGGAFAIDTAGNITTATALDYETTSSYALVVTVTDGGGLTDTAAVNVSVTNVNEAPVASDGSGSVAEDATVGTAVATVAVSDPDAGDSASFAITSGNTGGAFAIDAVTGAITTAAALDYETTNSYTLGVSVTDGGGLTDTATVNVSVTNANESPVFASDPIVAADGTALVAYTGTLAGSASDPDAGDTLSFSKVSGPAWLSVATDGALSGTPAVSDAWLNSFTVEVSDGNGGTAQATLQITVAATSVVLFDDFEGYDVENPSDFSVGGTPTGNWTASNTASNATRIFDTPNYGGTRLWISNVDGSSITSSGATVAENTHYSLSAVLLTETATAGRTLNATYDVLVGQDAASATSIIGGPQAVVTNGDDWQTPDSKDDHVFTQSFQTGALNPGDQLFVRFTRVGTAVTGGWFGVDDVMVDTVGANSAPVANDATFAVAENEAAGAAVGTVTATDADTADTLSYAITAGNDGGEFAIDSATGEITTTAVFDYETAASYALTVTVTDGSAATDTAAVTVNVTDVNEAPVAEDNSGSLAEDATVGAAVATVAASDVDAGSVLSYAITAGNESGAFAIDAGTGAITTAAALDFETTPSYALTVTVTDNGTPALSDTAAVAVTVTNVNEAPVANDGSGSVDENVSVGTVVATATSSDVDAGDTLSYAITAGNTGGAFAIDSNSGVITTAGAIDYEAVSSYALTVTVTDAGGLSDTAVVNVSVNDINEVTAPVVATGVASAVTQTSADVAYTISDDGGDAPAVTVYYGETDGGQVAGNWSNSIAQGNQAAGSYNAALTGLTAGTTYYFTVQASNSAGTVWGSSGSFTTEADTSPKLVRTTVSAVSSSTWTTVDLGQSYNSAVIVATPIYPNISTPPVVTRIRNVSGSSFDLKIDRADGLTGEVTIDVSVIAVEEGVYTQATDGVTMEAVKYTSTVTAENNSWVAEARAYQNSYTNPVVVGQVMSANDANWSVFWSMGSSRQNPVDASNLNVGKHVGEDPNATRADETIGYIVIESGNGTINGVAYEAGLGADNVRGFDNSSAPYTYDLSGTLGSASAAALSISGMDGGDGAWAVLSGANPITPTVLGLHALEDQMGDSDQRHTTTQVGYLVFE
ncbi:cadherin domain-containing protein [Sulfuriroseicoccus oceanibius]|uniref:Cadherin domain-containing protein n=1 Tax=Sulfuriroseicoccus oceanibius TaxID=2707525 RepID=A0A7T7JBE3_9BACT|nr:cadherin domain-containing protein [Sulfuriroseicoccus oceanibius]QQL43871.1 cadherin domain-containing protein [Sulfuriroseicoccus oceanibius]